MQTPLLALTLWYYGYYPTRSVSRGRHASRTPSKVSLVCAAQLLSGALFLGRLGTQSARRGRHRVSEHRARPSAAAPPPKRASEARGHDPAFWNDQHIKSRTSRSRMGAHG
jgi:hypothetical protein